MSVKIEKNTTIGDNNAIGDNASVNVDTKNVNDDKTIIEISKVGNEDSKTWFGRHPWLSAILCSLIASILMILNWEKVFTFFKNLFSN